MLEKLVAELQKQLMELQKKDRIALLTKQVAELEAQLIEAKSSTTTALPRAITGANEQRPIEFIPPKEGTCWGCGNPGHRLWACPKLSNAEKRKIRPTGEHCCPVCIIVKYRGRSILALINTGSDLTIAGSALAKKHHWKIQPAELPFVETTNGEQMFIEGVATVNLLSLIHI